MSCVLAAPSEMPTGIPVVSVIKDRFVPRLHRSVEFLPVSAWPSGDFVIAQSALCQLQIGPIWSSYSCEASYQIVSKPPSSTHSWKYWCAVLPGSKQLGIAFNWQPVRKRKKIASTMPRKFRLGLPLSELQGCVGKSYPIEHLESENHQSLLNRPWQTHPGIVKCGNSLFLDGFIFLQ